MPCLEHLILRLVSYSLLAAQSWLHTTSQIGEYNSDNNRKRIWPFAQAQHCKEVLERITSEEFSFILRKTTNRSVQIVDVLAEILNDFLTKKKKSCTVTSQAVCSMKLCGMKVFRIGSISDCPVHDADFWVLLLKI